MSLSSASSASPEPELSKQLSKTSKKKGKEKASTSGKNEGVESNFEFKPPDGATLLQDTVDAGEFDWDAIANDDDLELWLIRVPESIKPKWLENTKVDIPPAAQNIKVGFLNRKHADFDIWSIGDGDQDDVGGEEVKALSCLLPRKAKNGQLYPAPKPIARHMVISAQAAAPTEDPSSGRPIAPYSRPPRETYPKEALKHRFMPYGSLTNVLQEEELMEVDPPVRRPDSPSTPKHKKPKHSKPNSPELKKSKEKKRRGEEEMSPRKSKKLKI